MFLKEQHANLKHPGKDTRNGITQPKNDFFPTFVGQKQIFYWPLFPCNMPNEREFFHQKSISLRCWHTRLTIEG